MNEKDGLEECKKKKNDRSEEVKNAGMKTAKRMCVYIRKYRGGRERGERGSRREWIKDKARKIDR